MAKIKYFYNPHSLDFEKVRVSARSLIFRVFGFLSASIVAGASLMLIAYYYIDSPKEKILKRELENYELQTKLLNRKVDGLNQTLNELKERDNSIYRAIFEADPVDYSKTKVSLSDYKDLEGFESSEGLKALMMRVDALAAQVELQTKSMEQLAKLAENKTEFLASIPAIQPIPNKKLKSIASGFGYRMHPIYKTYKMHTGMDFTAPTGTPIYATGNGRVVPAGEEGGSGYGNHVVIDHGFGYKSLYAHMFKIKVRMGERVKRGQLIGFVGNTGLSSGPHLHYEVIRNGKKVNPINYFFNDLTESDYAAIREIADRPTQSFD
ncbi:MAG: M23 family metallopeptidase [Bacteroidia bacterium]|jgi:murein DD-endopeptidase MepM/ murein hydrolase activator NlpD|nr:M23 family metallopeptidase [Bacteroidia bacterium]